jgi:two-component system, LytTR family, response regulator
VKITVLVVDDEPLARRKLAALIADVPWAAQVGEARDGPSAVEAVRRLRPNVVFLDIQMPELSGIQVVERLRELDAIPAVVFTTAFDQYAVTAFELEAVDYLLKPFGARRFLAAFERARQTVASHGTAATLDRARAALAASNTPAPLARIFVREGVNILPLALPPIERVEAQDDYAMIHAHGRRYLIGLRLATLEARLPNPPFLRVHRSHIVNLDHVERMRLLDNGHVEVQMKDGATVPVSRIRSQELRRLSR